MNTTTITGNATDAPTVRFLDGGQAVCGFTVAHTPRSRTADGTWTDGQTTYLKVTVWGGDAEHRRLHHQGRPGHRHRPAAGAHLHRHPG